MEKTRGSVWLRGAAIALGIVAVLIGGSLSDLRASPDSPATIKIGCSNSITGNVAAGGKWIQQGYEIGVKHANEEGGVFVKSFGKKIPLELIFVDNESDPGKAATRLEKLSSVDKVDFFLGGFAAHLIIPQLAIAEKTRVPIIVTTIGSTAEFDKGYKYTFSPFMSEQDQVKTFLDVIGSIPEGQRPKKIAFFEIQEEWGVATGGYLKKWAPERGLQIVTYEKYAMSANDFSSLIIKAKSDGAEAFYSNPTPPQGIRIVKQMKELDWSPKFTFIMRSADIIFWTKNLGTDGDYVCHSGGWDRHLKLPGVEKFNQDYKAAYGNLPEPPAGSAYVCVQILADALKRAGTVDKDKVRDAIAATDMMTIMGPLKFAPNGRAIGKYMQTMSQWQKGNDELVWPKDQASAPLAYPIPRWKDR